MIYYFNILRRDSPKNSKAYNLLIHIIQMYFTVWLELYFKKTNRLTKIHKKYLLYVLKLTSITNLNLNFIGYMIIVIHRIIIN